MDYLQKQLQLGEIIRDLPMAVKRVLGDVDPVTTISNTASQHECTLAEIGNIFEEVRKVVAGQVRAQELAENIRPKLDPERQEQARTIAEEINRTVLGPIIRVMREPKSEPTTDNRRPTTSEEKFHPLPPLQKKEGVRPFGSESLRLEEVKGIEGEGKEPLRGVRTMPRDEALIKLLTNIGRGTPHPFEKIKAAYENVPEEVRWAVTSVDLTQKIQGIAEKHDLHIDEAGELGSEAGLVMIGLTHPSEFVGNLVRRLGVAREKALEIGREVNAEIFRPIRETLKGMYGINQRPTTDNQQQKQVGETEEQKVGLLEKKLSSIVSAPMEEVEYKVELLPPQAPKKYTADPYREPID